MSGERWAVNRENEDSSSLPIHRPPLAVFVVAAMETVLLALICLSPWAYGAVHPNFEFLLDAGIAVLLALWAVRMLLEGRIRWKKSGVALCLAGLFLLGVWQRTPLPRPMLAWLSPGTVRCYDQLLPKQPETLSALSTDEMPVPPSNAQSSHAELRPGSTLSLYPGVTQREAARLLAVFLVFVLVYNNLTSKGALIRLSIVALINGVFLSLFALIQFFSAPPKTVYWHYAALGGVFGPFINKNHFPYYVNVCIGLGIGLLVSQDWRRRSSSASKQDNSLVQMLRNPHALWICTGLGLMITAVAFSRSRGGLLALVGAAVLCGILGRLRLGRSFRFNFILLVAGIVVALSAWFGTGVLKDRLAALESGEAYQGRVPLWLRSLPIAIDFPLWGTGYGTFGYIEPMYRDDAHTQEMLGFFDHAHNDYLEILVEGGVVGLGLVVLALALVYRLSYRALARHSHAEHGSGSFSRAGLALGALFGFTALVLHSFGEFGMHIPAIALLATVVCAHLCALGHYKSPAARSENDSDEYRLRLGGLAPIAGAITALGFGLVLCIGGWKAHRVDRLVNAASGAGNADAEQLRTRRTYLAAAVSLAPEDAKLHYELGYAHAQLAKLLVGGASSIRRARFEHSMQALQEYLRARDACPLVSEAQLGIAGYAFLLKQGDKAEDYLRRVKLLIRGNAEMWYLCGLQEFILNRTEDAWASWRHCLELSENYLPQILPQTEAVRLRPDQLVEKVLPDNPEVLLAAAYRLYPDAREVRQRRPFLEKALRLLDSKTAGLQTQDLLIKARVHSGLNQSDQAIQAYRELLERGPFQVIWRLEFARYLYEVRRLEAAHHELTVVLGQDPKNQDAQELLKAVMHALFQEKAAERARKHGGELAR